MEGLKFDTRSVETLRELDPDVADITPSTEQCKKIRSDIVRNTWWAIKKWETDQSSSLGAMKDGVVMPRKTRPKE